MSSDNTCSSGSSLRSDGRKRKELPPDLLPSGYKRFCQKSCLFLTTLPATRPCEERGELRSEPDPSSISCVEDAPGHRPSRSLLSGKPLLSEEGETSCDTKSFLDSGAAETTVQSCDISIFQSSRDTSTALQESAASFDPGLGGPSRRRPGEMTGLRSGSRFLAIKRQKCHVLQTTVDAGRGHATPAVGCTRDVAAMAKVEEDGGYLRSQAEVKVVADGQEDQMAPVPVYVLSSGRISRAQEEALHGGSGGRPPTVDDEFKEYFSKLML